MGENVWRKSCRQQWGFDVIFVHNVPAQLLYLCFSQLEFLVDSSKEFLYTPVLDSWGRGESIWSLVFQQAAGGLSPR